MDRIGNEQIREELKVEPVGETIARNNFRWYGHVKGMEEDRYPESTWNGNRRAEDRQKDKERER